MQYLGAISNKTKQNKQKNTHGMISVGFQGKPFIITVSQVYAPTSNAEEADVEPFYDNVQDLLELTPKKDVLFTLHSTGNWNAKAGSREITGVTGRFGLGVQNEAGQRLIEFSRRIHWSQKTPSSENKKEDYTGTSPDGQYRNQTDYSLCSRRCKSFIQSAKTRPGTDCGSGICN